MTGEDFMGKVTKVAKQTHGGTTSVRTLERVYLFVARRWEALRASDRWCA